MGFMDRLFGRHNPDARVEATIRNRPRRDPATDPRPWDNRRSISVVGESNYQPALRKVSGAPASGAWKFTGVAYLVPEPTNPHDPKAVMIQVDGECVGYLSRRNASVFGPRVRKIIERERELKCEAFIGRGADHQNIGIKLHFPRDHSIFTPLAK